VDLLSQTTFSLRGKFGIHRTACTVLVQWQLSIQFSTSSASKLPAVSGRFDAVVPITYSSIALDCTVYTAQAQKGTIREERKEKRCESDGSLALFFSFFLPFFQRAII